MGRARGEGRQTQWWGDGPPPHERWPGVTIDFKAQWSTLRDRWETHEGRYYFDPELADRATTFFPLFLKHHIGEFSGQPFYLRDDQELLIIRPTFGWRKTDDGTRRFRKIFAFCPKGWGKSPMGAGIGLYLARYDGEAAAEVYAVAGDREQAKIVHDNMKIMVENSPDLFDGSEILKHSITWPDLYARIIVLSSDAATKHGFRPSGIVFDEMHNQKNRDLYEALRKSMSKRSQPLMVIITHAGTDDEGICVAPDTRVLTADLRWVRAEDVAEGDYLAGFDEQRDGTKHRPWRKSRVWKKTTAELRSYELVLTDGTRVVCSEDHMWLIQTLGRRVEWRKTKDLIGNETFFKVATPWEEDRSYEAGYLAGVLDSEGHLSATERSHMLCGFTQRENELSARCQSWLTKQGIRFGTYETSPGVFQTMVTRKRDVLRLLGSIRPPRLLRRFEEIGWEHLRFKAHEHPGIESLKRVGRREVVGLKTDTKTFVAEGIASHNCYEEYELAKRVLSGSADLEGTLPIIFEAKKSDDWKDSALWSRVNPGHGITVKHDEVAEECREAIISPRKKNDFMRYHLNVWTSQATAWIQIEWWDACESVLNDAELVTLECAAGLDMAQKWDLAAFVVVFRKFRSDGAEIEVKYEEPTGEIVTRKVSLNFDLFVRPYFWIPDETMKEHEREDGVSYSVWEEAGLITRTDGRMIDYSRMYRDITQKIMPQYPKLKEGIVGYDPAFASDIASSLRDRGGMQVAEVLQNYKHISEPCQVVEALMKGKHLHHDGHRVLRWNWENVSVKTDDAGRIRPVKGRSAGKRIDGAVAMIMGTKAIMSMVSTEKQYQMFFAGAKS